MSKEFKNRLKAMQGTWDTNRDPQPNVPAGRYTMQLQSAELSENSNGKLQIHTENLVIDGEYSGEVAHDFLQLENEIGMQFTARWIEAMGYDVPDDMAEIEEIVASIAEAAATFTGKVKVSKGFTNVQVIEILDPGEAPATESSDEPSGGDGEFEVGDEVSFEDGDGGNISGEITEIDGSEATVKDGDDDEFTVEISELTPAKGGGKNEPEDELGELIAFAQSQDIDVDDDDDVDSVTKKISEFEWDKKDLTDEEVELLESIDVDFVEEKKAKPKPKPKKKSGKNKIKKKGRK